jgi:Ras-related protein Rab-1A
MGNNCFRKKKAAESSCQAETKTPQTEKPDIDLSKPSNPFGSEYEYLFKVIITGDSGTGKSCLLTQLAEKTFSDSYQATIGVDFKIKMMKIQGSANKLQIWDTAGQERFRTITSAYYRAAQGVVLCYDITDQDSFNNLSAWLNDIDRYCASEPVIILVGNKNDLAEKRKIMPPTGKEFADKRNMLFVETSAKDNASVEKCFKMLCDELYNRKQAAKRYEASREVMK